MCAVNLQDNIRNWSLAVAVGDSRKSGLEIIGAVCGYAAVLLVQRIWPRRGGRARRSATIRGFFGNPEESQVSFHLPSLGAGNQRGARHADEALLGLHVLEAAALVLAAADRMIAH